MSRSLLIDQISHYLGVFSQKVKVLNADLHYDINKDAENIFLRILNVIFDSSLYNANYVLGVNYPAVDLIDPEKGIAFQITSQSDIKKISETLSKIKKNLDRNGIKELYVLTFTEKERPSYYRNKRDVFQEILNSKFKFEPDTHILDYRDILRLLQGTNRIDKFEAVLNILIEELEPDKKNTIREFQKIYVLNDKSLIEEASRLVSALLERRFNIYVSSDEILSRFANHKYFESLISYSSFDPTIEAGIYLVREDIEKQDKYYSELYPIDNLIKNKKKYFPLFFGEDFPEKFIDKRNLKIKRVTNDEEYNVEIENILKSLKTTIEGPSLKGYGSLLTILKAQSPNGIFEKLIDHNDRKQNIGYALYRKKDPVEGKVAFYLFLYEGTSQQLTVDYIKKNHPEIFREIPLIVLIPKEPTQKDFEKRLGNFKTLLNPKNIFYLDQYIWRYCTDPKFKGEASDSKFLVINNFVSPIVKERGNNAKKDLSAILEWLESENNPVLVLRGGGGVGKTTVAQSISDQFLKGKPESTVIFIDSQQIVHELNKRFNETENLDLYTFYDIDSQIKQKDKARLSTDLFKINLDMGNLLIILDGLDEVFAKVQNFDINQFLKSIFSSNTEAGNGKVLITCRDFFWRNIDVDVNNQIESFELLPFDREMAESFFRSKYPNDNSRIKRCMKYADSFIKNSDKQEYIPYVLDVISYVEESNSEMLREDLTFSSSILHQKNKTDYVIYRICFRETLKVKQINVDDQILFFIRFAVFKNGACNQRDFLNTFKQVNDKVIDNTSIETFKSHPLFIIQENRIEFRYDFLNDYYKSIYLSQYIRIESEENPSSTTMEILGSQCKYGSGILKDVAERIGSCDDDYILKISDLIVEVSQFSETPQEINVAMKRKAISGLFSIALMLQHKYGSTTMEANTKILTQLFLSGNNQLRNLSIIDFTGHADRLKFDFSGLQIFKSHINNFDGFWGCKFDENTLFDTCEFFNLSANTSFHINIPANIFFNPNSDQTFTQVISDSNSRRASKEIQIRELLEKFFALFNTKGKLERQGMDEIIKPRYGKFNIQPIKLDALLKILESEYVIEYFTEYNEEKIAIKDDYKIEVTKFIKEGTPSPSILNLIREILKRAE